MCMQIWVALDLLHVDSPTTLAVALLPLLPATNPSTTPRTGYCLLPLHPPTTPTTPTTPYVQYPYYHCYLLLLLLVPLGTTPNYPSERFMYRVYVFSMCCVSIVYGIHVFLRACIGAWIVFFLDVS